MAFGNVVEIVGNITRDPELQFVGDNGTALAKFGLAYNSKRGEDDVTSFFDVVCWQDLAENVAESLSKGTRVVVSGRLEQQTWADKETGDNRSKVQIVADEVSPSLRWASAQVAKNQRDDGPQDVPPPPPPAASTRKSAGSKAGTKAGAKTEPDPDEEPF